MIYLFFLAGWFSLLAYLNFFYVDAFPEMSGISCFMVYIQEELKQCWLEALVAGTWLGSQWASLQDSRAEQGMFAWGPYGVSMRRLPWGSQSFWRNCWFFTCSLDSRLCKEEGKKWGSTQPHCMHSLNQSPCFQSHTSPCPQPLEYWSTSPSEL